MSDNINQPGEYDAVLGNGLTYTGAAVLGGIEGVKQRLLAPEVSHRIAALTQAFKYGREGLSLVTQALDDCDILVRTQAYEILGNIKAPDIKAKLDEFHKKYYLIRFDGAYQSVSGNFYNYIKFYPDYTVIEVSTFDTPKPFSAWFEKDYEDSYSGYYVVDNEANNVKFSIHHIFGTVDYVGEINVKKNLVIESYSHVNSYRARKEYKFMKILL
ncbi:GUN4 domain protein (plasmid) [Calothrix sp. NIES-4071]|nr:GUN4 domain protein [Calothrix sp. NIES-4071]BAZ64970.1 GUN4 domain protein [Calothrix sp. NIES-4105]